MENLIEYRTILFGFTDYGGNKRIMAFQDGDSKVSLANTGFYANEKIVKFVVYKDNLYAAIRGSGNGRLLKLTKVNSGIADTWEEVIGIASLDESISDAVCSFDRIYLVGSNTLWYYDGTSLTVADVLPVNLDVYSAISYENDIFLYGEIVDYSSNVQCVYKYNDVDGFEEVYTADGRIDFDSYYDVYGKSLMVEIDGTIYFPIFGAYSNVGLGDGTLGEGELGEGEIESVLYLKSYIVSTELLNDLYKIDDEHGIVTTMLVHDNMILIALYDTVGLTSNIVYYVPKPYIFEKILVSGDGGVCDKLSRVDSDPINTDREISNEPIAACNEYPVMSNLQGKFGYSFKYGKRVESYTDIWDVDDIINTTLKDLSDQICMLTKSVLFIDGQNTASAYKRDVVGYPEKFMDIKHSNDYGDLLIKEVGYAEPYPNSYRRITINWKNAKWEDNAPVSVGSLESMGAVLSYDSVLVNDPITANNIAIGLLEQLVSVESLKMVLSFAHFLEPYDNVAFDVNRDFVYMDKDREYKLYQVEHDLKNKVTNLVVVERILIRQEETI